MSKVYRAGFAITTFILGLFFALPLIAQQELAFPFNGKEGAFPQGGVIADANGNLYGTTSTGGTYGFGVVYELSPGGAGKAIENVLYSFGNSPDGANPVGNLIFDNAGNLYGVTEKGGLGVGTVFELSPPAFSGAWTEKVLYSFHSQTGDGAFPMAGLVFDEVGNLYGTTSGGDTCNTANTVFELTPPSQAGGAWSQTVLYTFPSDASQGCVPLAPVLFDAAGNLYGTTYLGGKFHQVGTIFELSPPAIQGQPWTQTVLFNFNGTGGRFPQAGLTMAANGVLFGTASSGGANGLGTAFSLIRLDAQMVRLLMAQNVMPSLKNRIRSLDCPKCSSALCAMGTAAYSPSSEQKCSDCGHEFRTPGRIRNVVVNPLVAVLARLTKSAPRDQREHNLELLPETL